MINILATPSDNYAMPCGVMFYSACVNNPKGSLHFFVVTDNEFTDENKNNLQNTIEPFGNKIDFYFVDDNVVSESADVSCSYYPRYVFYRLFAFKFLPEDIDKILYLDCDIIIRKPLQELWNIDISSYGIAGVPDVLEGDISHYNRLEYPSEEGYFNAGVIFMNLQYWRSKNIGNRITDILLYQYDKLKFYDQDVLNLLFHDCKFRLHMKFNVQSGFYYKKQYFGFEYNRYKVELEEGRKDPVILHLCGPQPWSKGCTHPLKDIFFRYQKETLWYNEPLWKNRRTIGERIIDKFRKPLSRFGVSTIEDPYDRTIIYYHNLKDFSLCDSNQTKQIKQDK